MIVLLRDLDGREHRLGVAQGLYVEPEEVSGPERDLRRFFALPGLADSHAHLSGDDVQDMIGYDGSNIVDKMLANCLMQMRSGVLLVADKGSTSDLSLRLVDEDTSLLPHLRMAGRMVSVAEGYYPGFAAEIDQHNLAEIIGEATANGASWVKLVGDWPRSGRGPVQNLSESELDAIVFQAHAAGARVAIHTTAPGTAKVAVASGVDSIEHGLYLDGDDIELLGARGGAWVPTVLAMESTADWLGAESSGGKVFLAGLENVRSRLNDAIDAGVAVLAGTDLVLPHGAVAREAVRLRDYGLSDARAVTAVTGAAYGYMGVDAGFHAGASADLVLFEENPNRDVSELMRPAHVLRAGRVVSGRVT